jgi:heparanase 1
MTSYNIDVSVLGNSTTTSVGEQNHGLISPHSPQVEFHMSPEGGDIHSHVVLLNGTPLRLTESGKLPVMEGRPVDTYTPVTVNPLTYVFVALKDLRVPACYQP